MWLHAMQLLHATFTNTSCFLKFLEQLVNSNSPSSSLTEIRNFLSRNSFLLSTNLSDLFDVFEIFFEVLNALQNRVLSSPLEFLHCLN